MIDSKAKKPHMTSLELFADISYLMYLNVNQHDLFDEFNELFTFFIWHISNEINGTPI